MDLPKKADNDNTDKKTNWNEEYDAWLELIEDHLKGIRNILAFIAFLLVLVTILIIYIATYYALLPYKTLF